MPLKDAVAVVDVCSNQKSAYFVSDVSAKLFELN